MKLSSELKLKIEERPTLTQLRSFSSFTENQFAKLPKATKGRNIPLPTNFDGRKVWKNKITKVRNQGRCGSCWAFASTSTLADRFNIQSMGKMNVLFSPARLILCDFQGKEFDVDHPETDPEAIDKIDVDALNTGACRGNTLYDAWRYLYVIGTNTEDCVPYNQSFGGKLNFDSLSKFSKDFRLPLCNTTGPIGDMCTDVSSDIYSGTEYGTPARFYRCIHFYSIAGTAKDGGDESNIRHNIYIWGPVSTGMVVYPDFYEFNAKKDIYEWNGKGEAIGGHAIELVGWGEEGNKKYWIVKNSWGDKWGRDGYFYMARGTNTCKIEENIVTGVPDFFYPYDYSLANPSDFIWAETPKDIEERKQLSTQLTITGGGIDPTTGYTRRIMITKPWLTFQRPLPLSELPNWNTFIAGIDSKYRNNTWKWILLGGLIILILFVLVWIKIKMKK